MTTLFIRHGVENYDAWKKVYDDVASMQQHDGVIDQAVFRTPDAPNDVIVTHTFASAEAANGFLNDPAFADAMKRAGVNTEPTIWVGEKA